MPISIKKIIFTGGGSAGHVTPNLALIEKFKAEGWSCSYIGSKHGMETTLVKDIPYFAITTGKLRRYFSWHNFIDPFKILFGVIEAFFICHKVKPAVIFSKGGFVSFPVVVAAWLRHIPVVIHESDLTPGLANKLSFPFASEIFTTFAESKKHIADKNKVVVTGTPIRPELFQGITERGLKFCHFNAGKPTLLIFGGGLGAAAINSCVRALLPRLLETFQVVHICGKNKIAAELKFSGYIQFEYLQQELADILACSSIVISRSGANSLYELLSLGKPHILIPLPKRSSRGDQIVNAKHFAKLGFSQVIFEETLTPDKLYEKIAWVNTHRQEILEKLIEFKTPNSIDLIYQRVAQYI